MTGSRERDTVYILPQDCVVKITDGPIDGEQRGWIGVSSSSLSESPVDIISDFVRDETGHATLPNGVRLQDVRSKLSGYHFAKEAFDGPTLEVLFYAEALLGEFDRRHGGYAQ